VVQTWLVGLCGLAASAANAQSAATTAPEPSLRDALTHLADKHGLWGSVGAGRASAGLSCEVCAKQATYAYVLNGQVGIRVAPRMLLGAETFAWLDVLGGGVDRVARGSFLIARVYPAGRRKLFVHGGVGVASYTVSDGDLGFRTRSPAVALSTGFDWRLKQMILTPTVGAVGSIGGDLHSDRTDNPVDAHARLQMLRTGLAISWFRNGGIR
jgi:hypothetical protein